MSSFSLTTTVMCSVLLSLAGTQTRASDMDIRIITVDAVRYRYHPAQIHIPEHQPVELHFTSRDVTHGFFIPELNIRADLSPGKTTVVRLPGLRRGEYPFLCDIFCGSEHSHMQGKLLVR